MRVLGLGAGTGSTAERIVSMTEEEWQNIGGAEYDSRQAAAVNDTLTVAALFLAGANIAAHVAAARTAAASARTAADTLDQTIDAIAAGP